MLIFTTDKQRLLEHFRKDPVLFAYHIGDLDDFHFPLCQWGATYGQSPRIDDVLLLYSGLETPTLLAFGLTDKFPGLLRDFMAVAPPRFHCHFQSQYRDLLGQYGDLSPLGSHLKMRLNTERFAALRPQASHDDHGVHRLHVSHEVDLRRLYSEAYPDNYFAGRMLQSGRYLGYMEQGRLVAVAGIHVISEEHKVAVLGNITTHPDRRGQGLATMLTYRLLKDLVGEGMLVCLNVKADNVPAITCYEKLGFEQVHRYEEAMIVLR